MTPLPTPAARQALQAFRDVVLAADVPASSLEVAAHLMTWRGWQDYCTPREWADLIRDLGPAGLLSFLLEETP